MITKVCTVRMEGFGGPWLLMINHNLVLHIKTQNSRVLVLALLQDLGKSFSVFRPELSHLFSGRLDHLILTFPSKLQVAWSVNSWVSN